MTGFEYLSGYLLKSPTPFASVLLGLILCSLLSLGLALYAGSVSLSMRDLWAVVGDAPTPLAEAVLFNLRVPRALTSFAPGASRAQTFTRWARRFCI